MICGSYLSIGVNPWTYKFIWWFNELIDSNPLRTASLFLASTRGIVTIINTFQGKFVFSKLFFLRWFELLVIHPGCFDEHRRKDSVPLETPRSSPPGWVFSVGYFWEPRAIPGIVPGSTGGDKWGRRAVRGMLGFPLTTLSGCCILTWSLLSFLSPFDGCKQYFTDMLGDNLVLVILCL